MASNERQLGLFERRPDWPWRHWFKSDDAPGMQLYDRTLLAAVLSLIAFGFVMVMSASLAEAQTLTGNPFHFVTRHLIYLVGCVVICAVFLRIEISFWDRYSNVIWIATLIGLIAVLAVGTNVNGSTRWLAFGPLRIQVGEVAKFAFVVYMASYLVRRHEEVRERTWGFLKPLFVLGVYAGLILLQPDLGTGVVLFIITVGLLWLAGARLFEFGCLLLGGLLLFIALVVFEPYRMRRVTSFMDPWEDPFGTGYQLTQSLMAYGRGDWFGQGLGNSIQKLEYLPEAHTDFIFAVVGEELGFVGIVVVLAVLMFLVWRAVQIGNACLNADKPFDGYLAYGIGIWMGFQTVVNIGASIGMLPTKGLTLPFISYGGSSLWIMTGAAMILLRIDYERRLSQIQAVQGRGKK